MKFFRKRNIVILIIILVAGSYFIWKSTAKKTLEITTIKVTRGELIQSVEPTGSVKSKTEINLNFDMSGRIATINVKVGDEVKIGQILAKLETRNLESGVKQAEANLAKARGDLASYEAGSTPEVIAQYQADVDKAQANLNKAKVDLYNLKAGLSQTYQNVYNNQITNLQGAISPMETAMTDMDSVLGLANSSANDYFYKAVVDLDNRSFYYSRAKLSFNSARTKISNAKTDVNNLDSAPFNNVAIDLATVEIKTALEAVNLALGDTWTVLDKLDFSNSNNNISSTNVTSKKTTVDTDRTNITTKRTTVLAGEQNISTAKLNYGLQSGSVAASQVAQYEGNIHIYDAALASAEAALATKKAPPRSVDLESYRAAVASAGASLDAAQANLSKAHIYATVDGVVTKKNNEIGETNSLTQPVLVMLSNSNYEIEVNVSESDIAKIIVGQNVDITLDAFGDDHLFKGIVTMIDPAETLISDVVYYKVKVSIDHDESLKIGKNITEDNLKSIKAGMTANVIIFTNHQKDTLIIPERAVITQGNKKTVRVLVDPKKQTIVEKEVVVGLRGNEGMIEIKSGLSEGEYVVTFLKTGQ